MTPESKSIRHKSILGGPQPPCADCTARKLLCHTTCVLYLDFKKRREQFIRDERRRRSADNNIRRQQIERYKKR